MEKGNKRVRAWCFTINNPGSYSKLILEELYSLGKARYVIGQLEVGTNGTPHIQGFIYFDNPRCFGGMKKLHPEAHWEICRSIPDSIKYCQKDDTRKDGPWEFGDAPSQGNRVDLADLKKRIEDGIRVDDLMMDNPMTYHQYGRTLCKIEDICMRKNYRKTMTKGIWLWGDTGVGKSHEAFYQYNPMTHYNWTNDGGWWDGYIQQDTVILNDFRGEIPYNEMLKMVDKWPYSVRRRNREPMPFTSGLVIVTSSLPPEEIYKKRNEEDKIEQLLRRFEVICLNEHSTEEVKGNTRTLTSFLLNGINKVREENGIEKIEKLGSI